MEFLREQKKLSKKYLYVILKRIRQILKEHDTLVFYNYPDDVELTVCGDVHG